MNGVQPLSLASSPRLRRRRLLQRALGACSTLAALLAVAVLIAVVGTIIAKGAGALNLSFFTKVPAVFGQTGCAMLEGRFAVVPAFWAIALFRWDINVRESAVLGLVGAGGIGMVLDSALNLFQWNRVAMVLLAIFAVVIAAEIVVTQVRRRVI